MEVSYAFDAGRICLPIRRALADALVHSRVLSRHKQREFGPVFSSSNSPALRARDERIPILLNTSRIGRNWHNCLHASELLFAKHIQVDSCAYSLFSGRGLGAPFVYERQFPIFLVRQNNSVSHNISKLLFTAQLST